MRYLIFLTILTACSTPHPQFTGKMIDCKEVHSCSEGLCKKTYIGSECSRERKLNNEYYLTN